MAQKTAVQGTYDTETRVSELIPTTVTIGSHTFAIKRSGSVLRKIIAIAPDEDFERNDDGSYKLEDGKRVPVEEDPQENIKLLYESLSLLFRDPETGRPPRVETLLPSPAEQQADEEYPETFAEWLEEELDFDVAQELMAKLVPRRAEGNPTETSSERVS